MLLSEFLTFVVVRLSHNLINWTERLDPNIEERIHCEFRELDYFATQFSQAMIDLNIVQNTKVTVAIRIIAATWIIHIMQCFNVLRKPET